MGVQYYLNDEPNPREFDTTLFEYINENNAGELLLSDKQNKVVFDRENGSVQLVFVNPNPGLTVEYSTEVEKLYLTPIRDAVTTLAKLELLRELAKLDDPKIKNIYNYTAAAIQNASNTDEIRMLVERGFTQMTHSVTPQFGFTLFSRHSSQPANTPIQQAIYQALKEHVAEEHKGIDSGADVKTVLQKIHDYVPQVEPARPAR